MDSKALQAIVNEVYEATKGVSGGKNASYIPYLASVPSDLFGLAVVTVDGAAHEAGDAHDEFAIESISKVFNLALVMEHLGPAAIHQKVGADPTAEPFNSVLAIELHGGRPLTPLVNAGAISTVSLLEGATKGDRWTRMMNNYSAFAGRPLALNEAVYRSESETNFHNRGIAWLLYSYGTLYSDPMEATELYTAGCSIGINALDLATMGAVLANRGIHPLNRQRVISEANCAPILSEMVMEGLYQRSGDWFYEVGLPGKSGVGGGLLAVMPGFGALAAFSPPLDKAGNSVKGWAALRMLAGRLGLSLL